MVKRVVEYSVKNFEACPDNVYKATLVIESIIYKWVWWRLQWVKVDTFITEESVVSVGGLYWDIKHPTYLQPVAFEYSVEANDKLQSMYIHYFFTGAIYEQ